ncbi:MAG TPA: MFS transporter [Vicinamibacteria bacterium]|jgi:PAT family beta-lactamase induction signal transducer AmpG|nr:MFS transporter [Vicinamibacteria bacterium]
MLSCRVASAPPRLSTLESLRAVFKSPRLLGVVLLSLSSSLPLGLVWIAVPTWMTQMGVDIRVVGLFALAQAPWSFKFFWSPLVDRFAVPLLGRKRGWILLSQGVLFVLALGFARSAAPSVGLIGLLSLATAFASATQDIAIDAYTVEVLHPEEYGMAAGARTAAGRLGLFLTGGVSITAAATWGWPATNFCLGLLYLPLMVVTVLAPEPEVLVEPPKTLREAVWEPFVGFLAQNRALEILAFVILYKLSDQLAQALISPFLVTMGFSPADIGVNKSLVGTVAILGGTFLGGLWAVRLGLGRALWIFGVIQTTAHLGYAVLAQVGPSRPVLFSAHAFEYGTSGLANGAFGVFLLRLTQRRFSATQYALFSSLFAIPRVLAGPLAGLLADALGWRDFFILTVFTGIPGLLMLQRFVPWREREAVFRPAEPRLGTPLSWAGLILRAILAGLLAWAAGLLALGALGAVKAAQGGSPFALWRGLAPLLAPRTALEWTSSVGLALTGMTVGFGTAAALAVHRGVRRPGVAA